MAGTTARGGIGPVVAVSRSADKLDILTVADDGIICTAAWEPGDTAWRGWWQLAGGRSAPGAPTGGVSRSADKLDVFRVASDGAIYTAAWEPGDADWRGWWRVGDMRTTLHAPIAAVSRSADKLDIFATDLDGRVCTAAWEPGDSDWRGWWQIAGGEASPGAPVCAVSRSADHLDVFFVGNDHGVYTAAWEPGDSDWRGWWRVGDLQAAPRSPVTAVSRSADKLDVFVVGDDGGVYTAAWEPGDSHWRGWWRISDAVAVPRTRVEAVSRSADKLDVFVTAADGRILTAAWEPGGSGWRGWWQVAGGTSEPGAPVTAVSRSADKLDVFGVGTDAAVRTAAWEPGDTDWRGWWRIGSILGGTKDPEIGAWKKVGIAFDSENTEHSEEAQGMTNDGAWWFLASNGKKTIRRYTADGKNCVGEVGVPQGVGGGHVGAPGCFEGWLYVPIQHPWGVWKTTTDFTAAQWLPTDTTDDRLSWSDVNPLNGRLYTSMSTGIAGLPAVLFAYDRMTLRRCPEDDVALEAAPMTLNHVQGGVFTRNGRLILSRSDDNALFCYSSITGHCYGAIPLGSYGSTGSEVEGVTVWKGTVSGKTAAVHVLELDNDWSTKDDCYLHSYWVPDPDGL